MGPVSAVAIAASPLSRKVGRGRQIICWDSQPPEGNRDSDGGRKALEAGSGGVSMPFWSKFGARTKETEVLLRRSLWR
jgi:hypothetical protein